MKTSRNLVHLVLAIAATLFVLPTQLLAQSWEQVFSLTQGKVSGITSDGTGGVYAGTDSGVFVSHDHGSNWVPENNGLIPKQVFSITIASNGTLLAATSKGIFRSTDGGKSWTEGSGFSESSHIDCIVWDRNLNFYGGDVAQGVFFSSDDGVSWQKRNVGLPSLAVWSLAVSMDGEIFAGLSSHLVHSVDLGMHWEDVPTTPAFSPFDRVTAIGSDSAHNLFAGTSLGRFLRDDHGNVWTDIVPGPVSVAYSCMSVQSDSIYGGTADHGMMLSVDDGFHWDFQNGGIPNGSTSILCVTGAPTPAGDNVYAGTLDGKVFRMVTGLKRSVRPTHSSTTSLTFLPQWGSTRGELQLSLTEPCHVRIGIFDLIGKQVLDLGEKAYSAGVHTVPLNVRELHTGLFLAVVTTEEGINSTRVLISQ